jgi:drug/metabolite transporter (DMT)-like permease
MRLKRKLIYALVMRIIFQEPIPVWRYAGIILICFGILVASLAEG